MIFFLFFSFFFSFLYYRHLDKNTWSCWREKYFLLKNASIFLSQSIMCISIKRLNICSRYIYIYFFLLINMSILIVFSLSLYHSIIISFSLWHRELVFQKSYPLSINLLTLRISIADQIFQILLLLLTGAIACQATCHLYVWRYKHIFATFWSYRSEHHHYRCAFRASILWKFLDSCSHLSHGRCR